MSQTKWKAGATDAELARVEQIDVQLSVLAQKRARLTNERQHIANRACQRARYRELPDTETNGTNGGRDK